MHALLLIAPWINKMILAFSWTLLHSLWQGLLLAIVTGVVLMSTRKATAAVRYKLIFIQFLLFVFVAVCTFCYEWNNNTLQTIISGFTVEGAPSSTAGSRMIHSFSYYFTANAPLILMGWFFVFIARSVMVMSGWVYTRRLRHYQVYAPDPFWENRITMLSETLQLKRKVSLLESGYAKVPVVIGHLKPVILMPLGMLAGLPVNQVEAVLLHELSHILRRDYLVNLLQHITETIFFFNPGFLWISSLLREEREHCCDDMAIAQTGDKREFVQALISFKERALHGSAYAAAFPGQKGHLLQRVMRIVSNRNKALNITETVFFVSSILICAVMLVMALIVKTDAREMLKRAERNVPVLVQTGRDTIPAQVNNIRLKKQPDALKKKEQPAAAPKHYDVMEEYEKEMEQYRINMEQLRKDQAQAAKDQIQMEKDMAQMKKDMERVQKKDPLKTNN